MKFFSNDAKENLEDQAHDDRDLAESDPAAVPQQRAGSPWNDAPLSQDDPQLDDSHVRTDGDEPIRSDVDDTATAHTDAVDLPLDDDENRDRVDTATDSYNDTAPADTDQGFGDRPATDSDLAAVDSRDDVDERDGLGDREVTDTHTYGPDGTVTPVTDQPADDAPVDADDAVKDEGGFDDPQAVEPVTGEPLDADHDHERDEDVTDTTADFEPAAVAATPVETTDDDTTTHDTKASDTTAFDSTASDSTASDSTAFDSTTDSDTAAADDVVPVAVPVETTDKTPGSVEEPKIDKLFTDGDSFAERFRDIQLRFVDSPKDATAEAATLVGEAVDRVTSALKSQQESLSSKSEDTEQLRVELRGYRDMLNRLTSL